MKNENDLLFFFNAYDFIFENTILQRNPTILQLNIFLRLRDLKTGFNKGILQHLHQHSRSSWGWDTRLLASSNNYSTLTSTFYSRFHNIILKISALDSNYPEGYYSSLWGWSVAPESTVISRRDRLRRERKGPDNRSWSTTPGRRSLRDRLLEIVPAVSTSSESRDGSQAEEARAQPLPRNKDSETDIANFQAEGSAPPSPILLLYPRTYTLCVRATLPLHHNNPRTRSISLHRRAHSAIRKIEDTAEHLITFEDKIYYRFLHHENIIYEYTEFVIARKKCDKSMSSS